MCLENMEVEFQNKGIFEKEAYDKNKTNINDTLLYICCVGLTKSISIKSNYPPVPVQ